MRKTHCSPVKRPAKKRWKEKEPTHESRFGGMCRSGLCGSYLIVDLAKTEPVRCPDDVRHRHLVALHLDFHQCVDVDIVEDDEPSSPISVRVNVWMALGGCGQATDDPGRERQGLASIALVGPDEFADIGYVDLDERMYDVPSTA